jgi:AsmA protein
VRRFDPISTSRRSSAVKDKTGRTLAIDGDIKLKFFPKIGAQVGKVTLSERSSDKTFAGWRRRRCCRAAAALSKRVVVDEVRLDGLTAHLMKFKDGTTNFSDLAGGAKSRTETGNQAAPAPVARAPVNLDISGVRVTNAHRDLEGRDQRQRQSRWIS